MRMLQKNLTSQTVVLQVEGANDEKDQSRLPWPLDSQRGTVSKGILQAGRRHCESQGRHLRQPRVPDAPRPSACSRFAGRSRRAAMHVSSQLSLTLHLVPP